MPEFEPSAGDEIELVPASPNPPGMLAGFYPGALDLRALWTWAGGDQSELEFPDDPRDRWGLAWEKAGGSGSPEQAALIREALLDHRGDDGLLRVLEGLAEAKLDRWAGAGEVLVCLLEDQAPEFSETALWTTLHCFPPAELLGQAPAVSAYSLMAPSLQDRLGNGARERLEKRLGQLRTSQILPAPEEMIPGADRLLKVAARLSPGAEEVSFGRIDQDIRRRLRAGAAEGHERLLEEVNGLAPQLEELRKVIIAGKGASNPQTVDALFRFLATLRSRIEGQPPPPIDSTAGALVHAVWSTRSAPGSGDAVSFSDGISAKSSKDR